MSLNPNSLSHNEGAKLDLNNPSHLPVPAYKI